MDLSDTVADEGGAFVGARGGDERRPSVDASYAYG
jgi:hypothetical protein